MHGREDSTMVTEELLALQLMRSESLSVMRKAEGLI